jgi:hypothetical protein
MKERWESREKMGRWKRDGREGDGRGREGDGNISFN